MLKGSIELESDSNHDARQNRQLRMQGQYELYSQLIATFTRGKVSVFLEEALNRGYNKAVEKDLVNNVKEYL